MSRNLPLLFLVIGSVLLIAAGRLPINQGVLQTDLDAGGHSLTNVTSLQFTNGGPVFYFGPGGWSLRMPNWTPNGDAGILFDTGAHGAMHFVSSDSVDAFIIGADGTVDFSEGLVSIGGTLEVLDHFNSDGGSIVSDASGNLTATSFAAQHALFGIASWPPTFAGSGATSTNQCWLAVSNSIPPHWWFGGFKADFSTRYDGHIP